MINLQENTLCSMWYNSVRKYKKNTAFMEKVSTEYKSYSYGDYYNNVRDIALGIKRFGLTKGDKVAILSENRPEWAYVDMACLSIGIINVPIYPTLSPDETAEIISHSDCKWVFASSLIQFEKLIKIKEKIPNIEKVVMMDSIGTNHHDYPWIMDLSVLQDKNKEDNNSDDDFMSYMEKVSPDDIASIVYTSGTTGFSKGVMLTHKNFVANCNSTSKAFNVDSSDSVLSILPLSHAFERTAGYYLMMMHGVTIAYAENRDTIVENMGEIKPTIMFGVPRFYEKMYWKTIDAVKASPLLKRMIFNWAIGVGKKTITQKKLSAIKKKKIELAEKLVFSKFKEKLGGSLRFFISGGAPLAKEIIEFFKAMGIDIYEGYGTTETSPIISVNREELNKPGTVGKPVFGVDVKITKDGEIIVSGDNVMSGYYKMPKKTSEVLINGAYHTGDVGIIDNDGYITITGRKKDLIVNSNGKNIAPQKVERYLKGDSYIQDAVVYGDKKSYLVAIIVPNFEKVIQYAKDHKLKTSDINVLINTKEIKDFFNKRVENRCKKLSSFEKVRKFFLIDKEFSADDGEVTATLKIKRKKVFEHYQKDIDKLYNS